MLKHEFCCDEFAEAIEAGTDNEQYGHAIKSYIEPGKWHIGSIEKPMAFCPWCGTAVKESPIA